MSYGLWCGSLMADVAPATAAAAGATPNPLVAMAPPLLMMGLIFYMLVFRPNQKVRAEHDAMLKALKKNDEIVTTGGIHGTVVNVKETTIVLRVDETAKLEVDKEAIARVTKARATDGCRASSIHPMRLD